MVVFLFGSVECDFYDYGSNYDVGEEKVSGLVLMCAAERKES